MVRIVSNIYLQKVSKSELNAERNQYYTEILWTNVTQIICLQCHLFSQINYSFAKLSKSSTLKAAN